MDLFCFRDNTGKLEHDWKAIGNKVISCWRYCKLRKSHYTIQTELEKEENSLKWQKCQTLSPLVAKWI